MHRWLLPLLLDTYPPGHPLSWVLQLAHCPITARSVRRNLIRKHPSHLANIYPHSVKFFLRIDDALGMDNIL